MILKFKKYKILRQVFFILLQFLILLKFLNVVSYNKLVLTFIYI